MTASPEQVGGAADLDVRGPFTVVLQRSGITRTVPPGRSVLEVVEEVLPVPFTCRAGTCGSCVSPVLEGTVDYRNTVLSPRAKAKGARIALCVDRSLTPELVLDL